MPKAINICLFTYNTAHDTCITPNRLLEIINDGDYNLIVIDDPVNQQRLKFPFRSWMHRDTIVRHFSFADCNRNEPDYMSASDLIDITEIIKKTKEEGKDLIVSCIAGLSRSGAIVQAAIDYGFKDAGNHRKPNVDILVDIKNELGISINQYTSAFNFQQGDNND